MTALRKKAVHMIETVPEERLSAIIKYIVEYDTINEQEERRKRIAIKKDALDEILRLSKHIPNFDEEKEMLKSREERLIYENYN